MTLVLPSDAVMAITADVKQWGTADVRRRGAAGVETGGFLLAVPGRSDVSAVALAGGSGILRAPMQFMVSGGAIDCLSEWADEHDLRIRAQFHSHQLGSALSPIDRAGGLRVEGFVTAVVPRFADPPGDLGLWGWWEFRRPDWTPSPRATCAPGGVRTVLFDEDGIHE
ncbi:MAG: hypothetical protein M3083_00690 [Actinomycetota bacterium]|nr:hypothetical protein [Actinomycetota bacterium]MDQ6945079.1 hypothetical protein [Actinomycetota bacterium]